MQVKMKRVPSKKEVQVLAKRSTIQQSSNSYLGEVEPTEKDNSPFPRVNPLSPLKRSIRKAPDISENPYHSINVVNKHQSSDEVMQRLREALAEGYGVKLPK